MVFVRLANAADQEPASRLVANLLSELGGTPPTPEEMAPVLADLVSGADSGFIVVGEDGGRPTAVCTVSYLQALRARGRYGIIQEMYVEPDSRSTGVGMKVLQFALDHAVANGCSMVELGTPYHGDRPIAFYQRAGFTNVGARLRWRP